MGDKWEVEPEYELEKGCCCGSCYDFTGNWEIDHRDASEGPFLIGAIEEAKALADLLDLLDEKGREIEEVEACAMT